MSIGDKRKLYKIRMNRRINSNTVSITIDTGKALKMIITTVIVLVLINALRFPEKYITTWEYQLKNEIEAGNKQSIEYYEKNYIAHGKSLY